MPSRTNRTPKWGAALTSIFIILSVTMFWATLKNRESETDKRKGVADDRHERAVGGHAYILER